ncbi:MAG: hypothetical protein HY815_27140 [Candidatus Riflebacteria bacterium]|nr:hypothetical protein [Candidatus Riflebacteria bacterium]
MNVRRTAAGRRGPTPSPARRLPILAALGVAVVLASGCGASRPDDASWIEAERSGSDPSRLRLVRVFERDGARHELTGSFHSAWDPDVSPDARRVLFAGVRSAGGLQGIHEIELATGRVRTRIEVQGRLHSPRHAADGTIVFLWNTTGKLPDRRAGVLHALRPRSAKPQRITFHSRLDLAPAIAPDGRVVFGIDGQDGLVAVNWDGTEIWSYNEPAGPDGSRPPTPLEPVSWLEDGMVLLARSQGTDALFRIPASNRYYQTLPARPGDPVSTKVAVAVRAEPFLQPTLVEPQKPHGEIFCIDALEGRAAPPAPTSPRDWPRIRIHVFTPASATAIDGSERAATREVPLAPDGSFFAWVPADRGLRFELVSRGRVLKTMHSTAWVRPGEKRGCLGCHERHGVAPPNRVPLALDAPPVKVLQ